VDQILANLQASRLRASGKRFVSIRVHKGSQNAMTVRVIPGS